MDKERAGKKTGDRRLGDEWLDWDGRSGLESTEADYKIFLVLAFLAIAVIVAAAALFLWLIYPRLSATGTLLPGLISILFLVFCGILIVWLILFVVAAIFRWPATRWIIIPGLVNRLLGIVMTIGNVLGISKDRLTNSFLKIHNLIIGARRRVEPERLLVLMPRCLTKDNNTRLRELRDQYGFQMATVGGGTEARLKIRELRPRMVIAIACERDLISGFKEVNPYIPVIGFPNRRPEGPCKNTCIDLGQIEQAIVRCLA